METITLDFPLKIDGVNVTEVSYDFGQFTVEDYQNALKARNAPAETVVNPVNDYALHFAIGTQVILSSNKEKGWTVEDFGRVIGSDIWKISAIGLNFFGAKPASQPCDSSGGQCEPSRSDSIPHGATS